MLLLLLQVVTSRCSLVLATDKTLDDMDSPSRALTLSLQRLTSSSSRSNGIWAGGGAAAGASSRSGSAAGRQLSSISSSVGAVTRSSPLLRLSLCQTLMKPLNKSSRSSSSSDLETAGAAADGAGCGSGGMGGTDSTVGAALRPRGIHTSNSDGNLQAAALLSQGGVPSAAGGAPNGPQSLLGRPPIARHRRAHSSSSTGAVAGGDTIVSGAAWQGASNAGDALYATGSTSSGGHAFGSNPGTDGDGAAGSGGGGGGSGGTLVPAGPAAASAVNKAAIISFKKVELLVGTLDLNTDQVGALSYRLRLDEGHSFGGCASAQSHGTASVLLVGFTNVLPVALCQQCVLSPGGGLPELHRPFSCCP